MPELTCPRCGETFVQRVSTQKYCSRRCTQRVAAAKWYAAHPERTREYMRARRAANPEKAREASRAWNTANPEKRREAAARWKAAHRGKAREASRAWYAANSEKKREQQRAWWTAHPEKSSEYNARRRAANPEKRREQNRARRAARRGVPSEPYGLSEIFTRDKGICQLCRRKVNPRWKAPNRRAASIDHIVPISLGGHDTRGNVQLAHYGCNAAKQARTLPNGEQLRLVG